MEHSVHSLGTLVEQSSVGMLIRDAVLIYPIANVLHVIAVLVFFASVAIMDLRLIGAFRGDDANALVARFRPVAIAALLVLAATGTVLFIPEAAALLRNPSFQLKGLAILLALGNVALITRLLAGREQIGAGRAAPMAARLSALFSLLTWLAVAGLGRFIAYA
jgi:uncharacterized membrane protein